MDNDKPPRSKRTIIQAVLTVFLLLFLACLGIVIILTELKVARLVPGGLGESFSTRIFAAPVTFMYGSPSTLVEIKKRLQRSGYTSSTQTIMPPGRFKEKDGVLQVLINTIDTPMVQQEQIYLLLDISSDNRLRIRNQSGDPVDQFSIEPEIIAELSGPKKVRREPANWEEIPSFLAQAVVAVEDRRFYQHHGVDPRAIARALWANVKKFKKVQGGSTITQQLAKNFFLTQKPAFSRKVVEAIFAMYLDFRFSKQQILTLYLNHIYMGQKGPVSIAGVKSAARYYFDKDLKDINLPEAALLAGIIRSPYRYNPHQHPEVSRQRRDLVLRLMEQEGMITERMSTEAKKVPLTFHHDAPTDSNSEFDYFVAEVVRFLLPEYGEDMLFRFGLQIFTTVNPDLQRAAFKAVKNIRHQGALVCLNPDTGQVLALVGGTDFRKSQFNRATQAFRQPGSAFKPFVFGAGLEKGFTPATLLDDSPRAFSAVNGALWAPKNYDGIYRGPVSLRKALSESLNGATLDLAQKTGLDRITGYARKLGIISPLPANLTMALGSGDLTLLELTSAYAPFCNGGFRVHPTFVTGLLDSEGTLLEVFPHPREPVLDPAHAYLMISLLESTVKEGTARILKELSWQHPTAAKTGTTNDGKDAWFIGTTRDLLTGVWVGKDDATSFQGSGAKDALPIWLNFMRQAYAERPAPPPFVQPQGLKKINVDPLTGGLARSGCPDQQEELFVSGTEPASFCSLHAGGLKGFLHRIFGKKGKS